MRLLIIIGVAVIFTLAGAAMFFQSAAGGASPAKLEKQYMTVTDRFVMVDGARVRVREEGPREAPPLILIHGFTFSLETWDDVAARLSEDYRVIRYDLLGHGLTGPDQQKRYAPQERALFLNALMDALDIKRAYIAGNSLGGLTAWRFAEIEPERVIKLVLIDAPAFPFNGVGDKPAAPNAIISSFFLLAPEEGVMNSLKMLYHDDSKITQKRLHTVRDMMRRKGNGQAFIDHINELTLPDPSIALSEITIPTLIMWGREDLLVSFEQGVRMERLMPNADLIIYDGLGHVPHEESPDRVLSDMRAFFENEVGQ